MGVVPGLFNINEPILFGPYRDEPVFFLPFILVPMINATLAWFALDLGLVVSGGVLTPGPPQPHRCLLGRELGHQPGADVHPVHARAVMYYPFLKAHERSLLKQRREKKLKSFTGDVAMATRQNIR